MVIIFICDECRLSTVALIPHCRSDLVFICVQSVKAYFFHTRTVKPVVVLTSCMLI